MMRVFLLSILMATSYATWKSHCDGIGHRARGTMVGCMIVVRSNRAVATATGNMAYDKFKDWPRAQNTVLEKTCLPLMFDGAKFQSVQAEDDFSVYTFSGEYDGMKKPVMIFAPSKQMMIVAMFTKRESNVDAVCKIASNLKRQNTAATETDAEVGANWGTQKDGQNMFWDCVEFLAIVGLAFGSGYMLAKYKQKESQKVKHVDYEALNVEMS